MRICVSQINTQAGSLAQTADRMVGISQVAAQRGADLLVFPMATLTGPSALDYGEQDSFLLDLVQTLTDLSGRVACDCLVPVVVLVGEVPTMEVVRLHDGQATPLRFGTWAAAWDAPPQPTALPMTGALTTFQADDVTVGLACSYEELDAWCATDAPTVDVLCYVASYPYAVDDVSSALGAALGEARYVADARDSGCWFVAAGSLGGYGTQVYTGSSFVLAPDGTLVASAPSFEEDLLLADVGPDAQAQGGALQGEVYDERYHLWQAIALGIRDYVGKQGKTDVALALDGSLASLLLAAVATDALGPTHVHALLACPEDAPRLADTARLARSLRISTYPLPELGPVDATLRQGLVQAHLGALARQVGGIALSSLDKTALALEAQLYGTNAAQIAPLGDVYRVDVLDVARLRNTVSPVFPSLEVLPSDLPDVGLPIPAWGCESLLERMDAAVATHVEGERSLTEVSASLADDQLVRHVLDALRDCEAARAALPPCLTMTTKTLADAHMPVGFAWRDHLRSDEAELVRSSLEEVLRSGLRQSQEAHASGAATPQAGDFVHEHDLSEALSLLHDFALGPDVQWPGLFSEN